MPTKTPIIKRLEELEAEGVALIKKMHILRDLIGLGYTHVDEDDEPITEGDNVHNIAEARR